MHEIPVLMYHHVSPHEGDTVTVTPAVFAAQLEFLRNAGYRFVTLDELLRHIDDSRIITDQAVVITFDDCWLDNYIYAYPVLSQSGVPASFFVITGRADAASIRGCMLPTEVPPHEEAKRLLTDGKAESVCLDWHLIREMESNGQCCFFPHSVSHRHCTMLEPSELEMELVVSKQTLAKELGAQSNVFCWPYGSFNDQTVEAADAAGYNYLLTTIDGFVTPGSDPLQVKRIEVQNSLDWLRTKLQGIKSAPE